MFRKFCSVCLILLLIGALQTRWTAQAREKVLFPIYLNGKGGFISHNGQIAIKPQFDQVSDFSEGLAAVKVGDNWGYINEAGIIVISPRFVDAWPFSRGIACVLKDGYGFIDRNGSFVVAPEYDQAYSLSDGLARVGIGGRGGSPVPGVFVEPGLPDKWLYLDQHGKPILHPKFDYVDDFHEGFALVARRGKDRFLVNYINREGNLAFDEWFVAGHWFSEGVAIVSNDLNGYTGEHSGRLMYDNLRDDPYDLSGRGKPIDFFILEPTGIKTPAGRFESIANFSEGLAAINVGGKWGYLNKKTQVAIQPQFDFAADFSEGLASVRAGDKNFYIDPSGRRVLSVSSDYADSFRNGLARIRGSGKTGYIDKRGRVVWAPTK